MRACHLATAGPAESRPLTLTDVPDPRPGESDLLVRVRACGVCRTDLHLVEGDLPMRRSPLIPGHQVVGEVEAAGSAAAGFAAGDRVGIAWLHRTCGACRFCASGRENLCDRPEFTGWSADGGFAEKVVVPADFAYRLPAGYDDLLAAPLLCAGIIGYRALRLTGISDWSGAKLGIYGFGAAGHVAIQVARARGAEAYVCTRDRDRHQALARELGAAWVGGAGETPPFKLDAAVIFAPAGELVPVALAALDRGGSLVLAGIHMSPTPSIEYALLYGERLVRTVTNNTRADGREFLDEAARIPVRTHVQAYPLEQAGEALVALKRDAIRGAAVLVVD